MVGTRWLITLAVCASVPCLPAGRGQETPPPRPARQEFDPKQALAFPGPVSQSAQGEGAVWVTVGKPQYPRLVPAQGENAVVKVDPATRQVVATIPLDDGGGAPFPWGGAVWVQTRSAGRPILKIDPATNKVSGSFVVGPDRWLAAVGEGALWVTRHKPQTLPEALLIGPEKDCLVRIDPETLRTVATVPLDGKPILRVVVGGGAVWVLAGRGDAYGVGDSIVRIDPRTNTVAAVIPAKNAIGLAVGEGAVWSMGAGTPASSESKRCEYRIDLETNRATATEFTDRPTFPVGDAVSVGEYGTWFSVHDYHGDYSRGRANPLVWPEGYLMQIALPER